MFITDQISNEPLNTGYFVACFHAMDDYCTQLWEWRLALDFVKAFGAH